MLVERKIKSVYFGFSFFVIIDPHSLIYKIITKKYKIWLLEVVKLIIN